MALTYQQSKIIRDTVPVLREHGEELASIFYKTMLHDHPELKDYFNTVNQANGRQPRALTAIILRFASNISHTSELIPKLERVCHKHCSLGIHPEHYDVVAKYLLDAFAHVLGPAMTPSVRAAWHNAYWILARMLIGREAQLYRDFERWTGWRKFTVQRKVPETEDIWSFHLVPVDGRALPGFMPGQYVSVQVADPTSGSRQSRQYALSDAPRSDHYRISIKRDPGSRYANAVSSCYFHPGVVSNYLIDHVADGDVVELSHPAGEFYLDTNNPSSVPLVLISAGVGVAPMVAILNSVVDTQPARPVSWIHGSRSSPPFAAHIDRVRSQLSNFRTNLFQTDLAGSVLAGLEGGRDFRVDLQKVQREDLFLEHSGTEYFICGPEQFIVEMNEYLQSVGVSPSRVKYDLFTTGDLPSKA
ncbi:hypothetical protein VTK73DRAFT_10154 [Phialemonium thermophilum]|uniref:nitric oxide dioxygenase n=1 Tax=Phialemonium thermophilum TaxID=223376 RepID=A0ABR3XHX2_9PEZI